MQDADSSGQSLTDLEALMALSRSIESLLLSRPFPATPIESLCFLALLKVLFMLAGGEIGVILAYNKECIHTDVLTDFVLQKCEATLV